MAIGYTQGQLIDLLREHLAQNITSFATTNDSDDFQTTAVIQAMPTRTSHTTDQTAYSTQSTSTSWIHQLRLRTATGGQPT